MPRAIGPLDQNPGGPKKNAAVIEKIAAEIQATKDQVKVYETVDVCFTCIIIII